MKQVFEEKKVINLCGTLDKNEDGEYFVTVEDKDSFESYDLEKILNSMLGQVISLKSEIL